MHGKQSERELPTDSEQPLSPGRSGAPAFFSDDDGGAECRASGADRPLATEPDTQHADLYARGGTPEPGWSGGTGLRRQSQRPFDLCLQPERSGTDSARWSNLTDAPPPLSTHQQYFDVGAGGHDQCLEL